MTKTMYDTPYLTEFDARVLDVQPCADGHRVVLDSTCFFPEAGGQKPDRGTLAGAEVLDVQMEGGIVFHTLREPLEVGATVHGSVDLSRRFLGMQSHTAEHIVCGLIHSRYGMENVGFHLSDEIETFDVSGVLGRSELSEIEDAANAVVYRDLPVTISYPTRRQLASLAYRAKLDLTENVRIVTIEGVDACACCAPHVARTGEIGVIKLLDHEKHKGGIRVYMAAGARAAHDYRERYEATAAISSMLSVKQTECVDAVQKLCAELAEAQRKYKEAAAEKMRVLAAHYTPNAPWSVLFLPDATYNDLRAFANAVLPRTEGAVVLLSGQADAPIYVIASRTRDVKQAVAQIHVALPGRGGGSAQMVQGVFSVSADAVRTHFETVL